MSVDSFCCYIDQALVIGDNSLKQRIQGGHGACRLGGRNDI